MIFLPPLSLYIHIPWCVQKCPYCDFNSHEDTNFNSTKYIEALIKDLEQQLPLVWGRTVQSIFIGGGTPSLFSGDDIARLLSHIRALIPVKPNAEITIEANPNSADQKNFSGYYQSQVNRISIGAQSFNDQKLELLGRVHKKSDIYKAITKAKNSGFTNINIDLMFGLPQQSFDEALQDLETAISLNPNHISWYQLTIEPNTAFHNQAPENIPQHDDLFAMHQSGIELLKNHGYHRYEVSAFAKNDKKCLHNINYWQFGDYIGIGAGAHGKISLQDKIIRTNKYRNPKEYIAQDIKLSKSEIISAESLPFEFMLNALRLTNGIDLAIFKQRTFLSQNTISQIINSTTNNKFFTVKNNILSLTTLGQNFLDNCVELFLPN